MQQQRLVVTSPFVQNKIQLFYQASLNRSLYTLTIKIFNHRGILKNKKVVQLGSDVHDIYSAQQYVIGLDKQHQRVCVVDVRRSRDNIARGVIGESNGVNTQLRSKKLRFNSFIFDKTSNLIYGVYGSHQVFYFRINGFEDDSFTYDTYNNKQLQQHQDIPQSNKNISINKIITSTQSIDKLQIKTQTIDKSNSNNNSLQKIKKSNQHSLINCLNNQNQLQSHKHNNKDGEVKTIICLLIKEKQLLRMIEIDWNTDKVLKIKQQTLVHDFCFLNGWDLLIKYQKNNKNKQKLSNKSSQNKFRITAKQRTSFQQNTSLSTQYVIFTSQQNLFIIDPIQQLIIGVHNKQQHHLYNIPSIPNSINLKNTLLMVDRPDQNHLSFVFEVYDTKKSVFNNKKLLTPLYEISQGAQLQLYLKKNVQKIFTNNAFIHQYFLQKVESCVSCILKKQQQNYRSINQSIQRSNQKIQKSNQKLQRSNEKISKSQQQVSMSKKQHYRFESASQLARLFLQKFIMSQQNYKDIFDRLLFSWVNSGVRSLFGNKTKVIIDHNKSLGQKQSLDNSSHNIFQRRQSLTSQKSHQQTLHTYHPFNRHCRFSRWNQYFQQMIAQQIQMIGQIFVQSGIQRDDRNESQYSSSVENKFSRLYQSRNVQKRKKKLSLISVAYNRFLSMIQTYSSPSIQLTLNGNQDILNNNIVYYKQTINQNINKVHSLYLVLDIFEKGRGDHLGQSCDKYQTRIKTAVKRVFEQIQAKRKENILMYKKQQLIVGQRQIRINHYASQQYNSNNPSYGLLMLHEYFSYSRMLNTLNHEVTFQILLQYMLLKLTNFEQIAYFYHLIRTQMQRNRFQQQQRQKIIGGYQQKQQKMGVKVDKNINIKNNIDNNDKNINQQPIIYPYISRNLTNFFYMIESIPITNQQDDNPNINQLRHRIDKASKLALTLRTQSFTNYMLQLSASYSMARTIITLTESMQVSPFNSSNQLSQLFIYKQRLIMNSLLYCAFNPQNTISSYQQQQQSLLLTSTLTTREILLYQLKKILKATQYIITQYHSQPYYNNNNITHLQQTISTTLKHTLLQQFITLVLKHSQNQSIHQLQQLKNQCLFIEEDKILFDSTIDKVTNQWRQQRLLKKVQENIQQKIKDIQQQKSILPNLESK